MGNKIIIILNFTLGILYIPLHRVHSMRLRTFEFFASAWKFGNQCLAERFDGISEGSLI